MPWSVSSAGFAPDGHAPARAVHLDRGGRLLAFVGFVVPDSTLNRRSKSVRRRSCGRLSDTLDLLTISVEAGLSLNASIAQVVQNVPGVLSAEFARMLQEIQLGVPRSEAFRHLADRTDVEELNAFALAMIQADVFGVSIASVLRTQAQQLRIKRRQCGGAEGAADAGQDRVPAGPVRAAGPVRRDRGPRRHPHRDPALQIIRTRSPACPAVGLARRRADDPSPARLGSSRQGLVPSVLGLRDRDVGQRRPLRRIAHPC